MFIVMETSFAYNDEVYLAHENESGMPKRSFDTKEKAEAEARNRNTARAMELIGGTGYDNIAHFENGIEDFESLQSDIMEICGRELNGDRYEIGLNVEGLTQEQQNRIAALFNLDFFFVAECE